MVKLVWTKLSTEDLKDIFDYIAEDSKYYATITINKFYSRAQDLITNPKLGRIVPEINSEDIRELIIENYRIVYRIISPHQVDILRVYHSRRLLEPSKLK